MTMDMLVIEGGRKLHGDVTISGSKNAALPIMIATLLTDKKSVVTNVPDLADTRFLLDLLQSFGAQCTMSDHAFRYDCETVTNVIAHYDVVRKMRASVLVLAPLLARKGYAIVSLPGGCAIGTRPVDIHLQGLAKLGADIEVKDGYIHARLPHGGFIGAEFDLEVPSVGATENLIMAAVLAKGTTVLRKVAKEPEVIELCEALNCAGARIKGAGSATLEIDGVSSLNGLSHEMKPDRIEAGTFMALAAATRSTFKLLNVCFDDVRNILERFIHAGVIFTEGAVNERGIGELLVHAGDRLRATDIETAGFPGFPTDMQAQFMAAMCGADGVSTIYERVFENRMMHVPELRRMGAKIDVKSGMAKVEGVDSLSGAPVMATDLRASASLVIAALAARGQSEIRRVYHLDRGYEAIEKKLVALGAEISRSTQVA